MIDINTLVQVAALLSKVKVEGKQSISDYSPKAQQIISGMLSSETIVQQTDLNPDHILIELDQLTADIRAMKALTRDDPSAQVQLAKLQFSLMEKRHGMLESLNQISEANQLIALVTHWFENELSESQLMRFMEDLKNLNT